MIDRLESRWRWTRVAAWLAASAAPVTAQNLGGGAVAEHGRVPEIRLEASADQVSPPAFAFVDLPESTVALAALVGAPGLAVVPLPPGISGELRVDLTVPGAQVLPFHAGHRWLFPGLMPDLEGARLAIQGVVVDGSGVHLTDAVLVVFRNPAAPLARLLEARAAAKDLRSLRGDRGGRFARLGNTGEVLVIAHRGASRAAPENTLTAIRAALTDGADHVEVDVRRSRDGVAVLMHDWVVDRTTDGRGFVAEHTAAELAGLNAAARWPTLAREGVPSLAAALGEVRGGGARLLLDVKEHGLGRAITGALREAGVTGEAVWLFPPDESAVVELEQDVADAPILWSSPMSAAALPESADWLRSHGVVGFDLPTGTFDARFVAAAHAAGLGVFTFRPDHPTLWREALALGVDGMETDTPAELRAFLTSARAAPVGAHQGSSLLWLSVLFAAVAALLVWAMRRVGPR